MFLPFFKKTSHHYLYTLLISKSVVGACAWHVENGKVIVDVTSALISWDEENEASLFDAADTAISSLTGIEATQVLLSLPDDWVQGQGIHPKRKPLLKTLTGKLELSSVGFVVTMEALIAFLKEESSQPLNLVCASIEPDAFIMSVVNQGNASPILRIGRSGKVVDDFLEGCSRLKAAHVPPQMLFVSLSESQESLGGAKQELESFQWDPALFVQPPSVSLESAEFLLVAVASSGGKEVAKAVPELMQNDQPEKEVTESPVPDFQPVSSSIPAAAPAQETTSEPELALHEENPPSRFKSPKKIGLIVGIVLGALLLFSAVAYAFVLPKIAKVEVTMTRQRTPIETTMTLTVDSDPKASGSGNVVKGQIITLAVSGSKDAPTTGKKQTGDKATGTVTLFNKTAQSKKFPSGTQLKSGKLIFVTTEDSTVASASAGQDYTVVPGKATVKAQADFVGEEGNIDKNKELGIGTYDATAYVARTESSFTGGTSRTVQAVAAKDQDAAVTSLLPELKEKATSELQSRIGGNDDGLLLGDVAIASKKFDKAVGEEATAVSLNMSASASALLYKRDDVLTVITEKLKETLPPGATIDTDHLSLHASESKKVGSTRADIVFTVSGKTISMIDTAQFTSILAGKTFEEARNFLESQTSVDTYTIKLSPPLFAPLLQHFPSDASKIAISLQE